MLPDTARCCLFSAFPMTWSKAVRPTTGPPLPGDPMVALQVGMKQASVLVARMLRLRQRSASLSAVFSCSTTVSTISGLVAHGARSAFSIKFRLTPNPSAVKLTVFHSGYGIKVPELVRPLWLSLPENTVWSSKVGELTVISRRVSRVLPDESPVSKERKSALLLKTRPVVEPLEIATLRVVAGRSR